MLCWKKKPSGDSLLLMDKNSFFCAFLCVFFVQRSSDKLTVIYNYQIYSFDLNVSLLEPIVFKAPSDNETQTSILKHQADSDTGTSL